MSVKFYYLVDASEYNREVHATQFMSDDQLAEAQQQCTAFAGGAFYWIPTSEYAASLPKSELYRHIPSLSEAQQNI